ncbi:CDGSH iron-sulfur domain-containing protein [Streptomyces olivochromogenes]|uniref:CDGSH iron-sulfur domain-containing protein n=1 Tax=Streptomyces olivochromogenes TaxID=1963 RepID=UPI00099E5F27|nr:CDGSH iron-sulfur domain-containing protein [Streptomyces olivochromogenes]
MRLVWWPGLVGFRVGQLTVPGELSVDTAEGPRAETSAILCTCGRSGHQPHCDHSGPCGE